MKPARRMIPERIRCIALPSCQPVIGNEIRNRQPELLRFQGYRYGYVPGIPHIYDLGIEQAANSGECPLVDRLFSEDLEDIGWRTINSHRKVGFQPPINITRLLRFIQTVSAGQNAYL